MDSETDRQIQSYTSYEEKEMSNKAGGPAFPTDIEHQNGSNNYHYEGMTLRDYFAAKAMQSFTANIGCGSDQKWFDEIALGSYRVADAMLKAKGETE